MIAGEVNEAPSFIQLNGFEYQLLRGDLAEALERRTGVRRWKVTSRRLTTQINPSRNLRAGEIEGEWLLTIEEDDWTRGQGAARGEPGQALCAFFANGLLGGVAPVQGPLRFASGDAQVADPAAAIIFNRQLFLIMGRYAYRGVAANSFTQDRDFGAGIYATDALIHNEELIVVFGGAANKIQKRNAAGTWTTATDAVYSDHITHVKDRYWRVTATNQVSNIGPIDNPFTLASYSAGITVGAADIGATDLNGYGERVAVSKPEGLFLGDSAAQFPNVLPQIALAPEVDNGKSTLVHGVDILYPHAGGLIRWSPRGQEEIGLQRQLAGTSVVDNTDADGFVPAVCIRSLAAEGHNIWAACEPSGTPWIKPTVLFTVNNGVGYTNRTTNTTDNDYSTTTTLALDTVANGDWLLIGTPSGTTAYGFFFDGVVPNTAAAVMTVEYWNGSGWTAYTATGDNFRDGTSSPGLSSPSSAPTITLSRSGYVLFPEGSQPTLSTINSLSRHWWRISFNNSLAAEAVGCAEIRAVLKRTSPFNLIGGELYRLRPARSGDLSPQTYVWEPYSFLYQQTAPTALLFYDRRFPPYGHAGNIVAMSRQLAHLFPLPLDGKRISRASDPLNDAGTASYFVTSLLDGGIPNTNKQWTRIRIRSVFSTAATIAFATRVDDTAAWSSETTITSDDFMVSLSNISGRRIALRLNLGDSLTLDDPPRILSIELVYRTLDTYVEETEMVLLVADHQSASGGGELGDAKTQITRLEALRGTAARTFVDPLRQTKTVTVFEMQELEVYQFGQDMAGVAVQVRCVEE